MNLQAIKTNIKNSLGLNVEIIDTLLLDCGNTLVYTKFDINWMNMIEHYNSIFEVNEDNVLISRNSYMFKKNVKSFDDLDMSEIEELFYLIKNRKSIDKFIEVE